ncbi:MAG: STAS domain-containing protein [Firmicutes bacterium]|jgi:anti-sigma B factor antagonist|nr:STAS domain-containing protein [Bacillota bacterium]
MNIIKKAEGEALTLALEGRLDTITSPQLDEAIDASLDGVTDLTLDLAELTYISSAGLRVLLRALKKMNAVKGKFRVTNANDTIMEIFDVTGFAEILTIE